MRQPKVKNDRLAQKLSNMVKNQSKMYLSRHSLHTGINRSLISRISSGSRYPSHDTWAKIVAYSNGNLTMKDWDETYSI